MMRGVGMTIVVTGGGSGGHITPILAVARELKQLRPDVKIVYIGQKGDKLSDIPAADPNIDTVYTVQAGKFRRYHGEGWRQILALPTQLRNICDAFKVLIGLWQSYRVIGKLKPDIIFSRGGFVSVPVALGGKLRHVPYITHDSDSVPSLANRIIAKWAQLHAVALPVEVYPYPAAKTINVGIPVSREYHRVTQELQQKYRQELELSDAEQVVFVTGGGNGAGSLNDLIVHNSAELLTKYPKLYLIHVAGRIHEANVAASYDKTITDTTYRPRVLIRGFITDLYRQSGAADVVITRAGATNLAEFAIQGKPCIVIPADQLVGGHQTKNAQVLADHEAVVLLPEIEAAKADTLAKTIEELLDDSGQRERLSENFTTFAHADSAYNLATLLLSTIKTNNTPHETSA